MGLHHIALSVAGMASKLRSGWFGADQAPDPSNQDIKTSDYGIHGLAGEICLVDRDLFFKKGKYN